MKICVWKILCGVKDTKFAGRRNCEGRAKQIIGVDGVLDGLKSVEEFYGRVVHLPLITNISGVPHQMKEIDHKMLEGLPFKRVSREPRSGETIAVDEKVLNVIFIGSERVDGLLAIFFAIYVPYPRVTVDLNNGT